MMSVQTRHSESVPDVNKDVGQRVWGRRDLSILEREVKEFKRTLVESCDEQSDSRLHILKVTSIWSHWKRVVVALLSTGQRSHDVSKKGGNKCHVLRSTVDNGIIIIG